MPASNGSRVSREDRTARWFRVAQSWQPSFTHDDHEILFLSDASGLPQAFRVPVGGGTVQGLQDSPERIGRVDACPTLPRAVLSEDSGGNEMWQLELLALAEGPAHTRGKRRPLTADPRIMNLPGRWMTDGHRYLFSSNARNHRYFDVYSLDVDGWSPPERIWTGDAWQEAVATLGERVLVQRYNTFLDSDLFLLSRGTPAVHLNPHSGEVTVQSAALGADSVYAATNPGEERLALYRYPLEGSPPERVQAYPGEVEIVRAGPDGRLLAVAVNREGWSELHLVEASTGTDRKLSVRPRGVIEEISWRRDGSGFAFDLSWPNGHEIFAYDLATRRTRQLTRSPVPAPARIPEPHLHSIRSQDGLELPYWEFRPARGTVRGTILSIHGGPESQARPFFDPEHAAIISGGWRVILPNVRGSTGYGRTYLHSDDVRQRMDSVRDVRDIAEALVHAKTAKRGRLGIVGGSYGGFMVLSSITTYPDLWGAAVELFGISNFVTFLERTADWRRRLREAEYGSLERDREFLESISPIHHLDQLRAPLLVFHGRNDPRVPIHEAEQIVRDVEQAGHPIAYRFFENEGHGFFRRENRIETVSRSLDFFEQYLSAAPEHRGPSRAARLPTQRPRRARTSASRAGPRKRRHSAAS